MKTAGTSRNGLTRPRRRRGRRAVLELGEMSRIYDDLRVEAITNGKRRVRDGAADGSAADGGSGGGGTDHGELRRRRWHVGALRSRRSARRRARRFGRGRRRRRVHDDASACARLEVLGVALDRCTAMAARRRRRRHPGSRRGGKARRGRKGDAAFTRWHSGVDDPKAPGSGDQLEPRSSPLPLWAAHPFATGDERGPGRLHQPENEGCR